MVAGNPWDSSGEARRALHGIVTDPHYGAAALSQPAVMSNLLKDLLPDQPREAGLLVAAAQADLAGTLRGYVSQGLDPATAAKLTTGSFVSNTSHTPEACTWVVSELVLALGLDAAGQPPAPPMTAQQPAAAPLSQQTLPRPAPGASPDPAIFAAPDLAQHQPLQHQPLQLPEPARA